MNVTKLLCQIAVPRSLDIEEVEKWLNANIGRKHKDWNIIYTDAMGEISAILFLKSLEDETQFILAWL